MVAFERYMVGSRDADWAANYIDYGGLKALLAESVLRHKLAAAMRKRGFDQSIGDSASGASVGATSDDLFSKVQEGKRGVCNHWTNCDSRVVWNATQALDREVEKVVIFFLKAQGEIADKLLHLRLRMRAIGPLASPESEEAKALRLLSSVDPAAVKTPATPALTSTGHHRRMYV